MRIVLCCMIGNPVAIDLGDAEKINETWNSKKYQVFRRKHLSGSFPDECRFCYN